MNTQNTINDSTLIETINITERFGAAVTEKFANHFISLTNKVNVPRLIILNFTKTLFIDSSGIGALAKGIKISKEKNIKLIVANVNQQIMSVFKMTGLDQSLNIDDLEFNVNNSTLKNVNKTHPSINSTTKRVIDIIGSIVGLFITALVFIPIYLAIKLDSPGPIFFKQQRVGWMSKRFQIYKFRTMANDAEDRKNEIKNEAQGAIFKCKNDPRITNVGKFLRRTSLDELPQFWNVLQGSMSLVGTRPPTQDELEQYNVPHWRRLDVKPGITGEWQVNGRSSVKNFEDIIQLDLDYQRKWSLFYDIKLIIKTVAVIFSKDSGAM